MGRGAILSLGLLLLLLEVEGSAWDDHHLNDQTYHSIVRKTIFQTPCLDGYLWNEQVRKCTKIITYNQKAQEAFRWQRLLAQYTGQVATDSGPMRVDLPLILVTGKDNENI